MAYRLLGVALVIGIYLVIAEIVGDKCGWGEGGKFWFGVLLVLLSRAVVFSILAGKIVVFFQAIVYIITFFVCLFLPITLYWLHKQ